jgi:glycosyltransferase involved in cell wall biosynthesis
MKIGISTSVIQRGKTGVASYLFSLIDALANQNPEHRFSLFVLEEDQQLFANRAKNIELIPVAERHRPPIKNILWHQAILPGIAAKTGLDLLHIPSYRRLMLRAPCPKVGTIHDLAPFQVANKYDYARMFYGRVVVKFLAHRQEQIIAVSRNTARDIQTFFGIPARKITVIHNGLNHQRFCPASNAVELEQFKTAKGLEKPFFLYVARLEHPGKNHVRLIEAFDAFKQQFHSDWQLVLGGSDWHGAEATHARIAASPFRSDIRAPGFVSNEDLPNLYRAASAFVYPSMYEGFGMPPIEAMACGIPVICSASGSLGEVVGDAALIVDPERSDGIAQALGEVAQNSSRRQRMTAAGLRQAAQFTWQKTAAQTWAVYQKALGRTEERPVNAGAELSMA